MPKITAAKLRDWIGTATALAGDVYGIARTIYTLVGLFGEDFEGDEDEIKSNVEEIEALAIKVLDRLTAIEDELDRLS